MTRKKWTAEEIEIRYKNSYPKPIWDFELQFYYDFLEKHRDCKVANKLYRLMMEQEIVYADKTIVFFDNDEIGVAWTELVWELGKELIAYMKERIQ